MSTSAYTTSQKKMSFLRSIAFITSATLLLLVCLLSLSPQHKHTVASYEDGAGDIDDPYDSSDSYGSSDPYDQHDSYGYDGESEPAPKHTSARKLSTLSDIDDFLKESDAELKASVIGYFDQTTHASDLETFEEVADQENHKVRFAYTTSKEVLEEKKYDGFSIVVHLASKFVSPQHDKAKKYRYPAKSISGVKQLKDFIYAKALPLVGEMTLNNKPLYDAKKIPYLTYFTAVDLKRNFKGFNYIANRIRKIAKDFKAGIKNGDLYYRLSDIDKFSAEALQEFIQAFFDGKLQPTEKRTPPPPKDGDEDDGDSAVLKLTDDNVKSIVTDSNDSDVLVEFYAPWCGHCKQLKPEYEIVAKEFQEDAGVTIAAMDATASTVPKGFDVSGYPTIYFVPANTKKPIAY
eukprot:gene22820-29553_t